MKKRINETNILLKNIINAIQNVKGQDIISLDFKNIESTICKHFVICTGTSNIHVNAIEGTIKKQISKQNNEKPWHIEGSYNGEWVLMDYSDIVVHIFQKKIRKFYDIESFWGDTNFTKYK